MTSFRAPVPASAMQTFGIVRPPDHFRPASCAEVECEQHANGWETLLLAGSDDLAFVTQRVARGEVDGLHRSYTAEQAEGGFVRLRFPAGNPCFRASSHRVSVERPPIYLVRPGDRRSNMSGDPAVSLRLAQTRGRIHTRPEHWVEHSAETLDSVRTIREKG